MTNKTTEQDMEAESVDKNNATQIESPDNNEETVTGAADDTLDAIDEKQETPETAEAVTPADLSEETEAEAAEPEIPEPVVEKFDDSVIAPGSLSRALKKCREAADMSMGDAAGEMHLPLSVIKALEEENFADLPDPPYVRGYLRSYARLNESDATNLINHYETLRGADPRDSSSFTPVTPRYQPNSKKAVSPTTIKLAGFSMIVLLMVVLSMIPAVSQWASDTWQSFSEPQNQKLAAAQKAKADAADNTEADTNAQTTAETAQDTNMASSSSDTAMPGDTEQLALNQEATDTDSTGNTAEQDNAAEQTTESTATDTPAGETEQAAEGTDTTEIAGEDGATDKEQATSDTDESDPTVIDGSNASATETTNTDTAAQESATTQEQQDTAAAGAEAAKQKQAEAQAAAEKAAAEKAAADKVAAQQAAAQQGDNFQQPIDGSVLIRLVFTQDVWMSIKDGRGKTIFGALNAAGTRKDLKANTPLQFKVGNAPGVQIYLNGQLIDQKPYTRGSVATFRAN